MLQSVPAPAEEQRPKKTFPEFVAAIYEDPRIGHETRELLLAIGYAVDLAKREEGVSPLQAARRKLGVEHGRQARYNRLVADDAPRYKPPRNAADWQPSAAPGCQAPRLRPYKPRPPKPREEPALRKPTPIRPTPIPPDIAAMAAELSLRALTNPAPAQDPRIKDGICGANSHHRILEKDPRTGWITAHWFCKRHKGHADRVAAQVKEQNELAPEPVPNRGGLLPCYFKADWEKVYRRYRPHWTPPSYGLAADDWPTPKEAQPRARGRLRAISSLELEENR